VKRIEKIAKDKARSNRTEELDFFAVYYKQYFPGCRFKEFKNFNAHPERILAILSSD
jgi:hypothetical protein